MEDKLIISYLTLRKAIGWMGIVLGVFCLVGGLVFAGLVRDSISAYYHSNMRDVMVGVLAIAGAFLLSYKGYDRLDNIMANVAGVSALLIALFPCYYEGVSPLSFLNIDGKIVGVIHFMSAAVFFITISCISYFLFTKSNENPTKQKLKRNKIYRICGIIIISCVLILALFNFINKDLMNQLYLTLILEIVMLISFGIPWLIKGEVLLKDSI